jgi:hypothetical protein
LDGGAGSLFFYALMLSTYDATHSIPMRITSTFEMPNAFALLSMLAIWLSVSRVLIMRSLSRSEVSARLAKPITSLSLEQV